MLQLGVPSRRLVGSKSFALCQIRAPPACRRTHVVVKAECDVGKAPMQQLSTTDRHRAFLLASERLESLLEEASRRCVLALELLKELATTLRVWCLQAPLGTRAVARAVADFVRLFVYLFDVSNDALLPPWPCTPSSSAATRTLYLSITWTL